MVSKTEVLRFFGRDFRPFFERYGLRFANHKRQTLVRCPWHDDQHPSLSVNTAEGTFCCHAGCGSGNIFDFYARRHGLSPAADFARLVAGIAADFGIGGQNASRVAATIAASVEVCAKGDGHAAGAEGNREGPALLPVRPLSAEVRAWLTAHHKIYSDATLEHFDLGESEYRGEPCLVIPLREDLQKLYFRRENKQERWQHHPRGKGWLLDENDATDEVILCEGEWDFLTLYDRGYRDLATGTTGAASLPKGLAERLQGKAVTIVYDRDEAGRAGAKKAALALQGFAQRIRIAELPDAVGEHGDVSDFFRRLGGSAADFEANVLRTAQAYEPEKEEQAACLTELEAQQSRRLIHPAQDFVQGVMYYAAGKIERPHEKGLRSELYLLSSERKFFSLSQGRAVGLSFRHEDVQRPALSKAAIERFLAGSAGLSPADVHRLGLEIAPTWIPHAAFSPAGLADYLTGQDVPAAEIYRTVREHIAGRVVLKPESYAHLLALWTMGTYVHRIFRYYPYLWVHGTQPRGGKTRRLETLQPLVFNGLLCPGLSGRALYRLSDSGATLLMDDVHGLRQRSFTRAALASGFRKGAVVPAWERDGEGFRLRCYSTYSPKVLVGDPESWPTLWDKTLPVGRVRKACGDPVLCDEPGIDTGRSAQDLTDDLHIFGLNFAGEIAALYREATYPFGLKGVRDRELDVWPPLWVLAGLIDREQGSQEITEELMELR